MRFKTGDRPEPKSDVPLDEDDEMLRTEVATVVCEGVFREVSAVVLTVVWELVFTEVGIVVFTVLPEYGREEVVSSDAKSLPKQKEK